MEWNLMLLWKIYNLQLNGPWGWSTCHRIWYKMIDCFLRHLICRYHVSSQKWVRERNICTSRFSCFGIVSASQDCILWRCKERKQKLCWLKNKHRDLKWKDLGALETMRMRNKIHDDNHKNDFFLTCRTRAEQFVRENFKELKSIFSLFKKSIWNMVWSFIQRQLTI